MKINILTCHKQTTIQPPDQPNKPNNKQNKVGKREIKKKKTQKKICSTHDSFPVQHWFYGGGFVWLGGIWDTIKKIIVWKSGYFGSRYCYVNNIYKSKTD